MVLSKMKTFFKEPKEEKVLHQPVQDTESFLSGLGAETVSETPPKKNEIVGSQDLDLPKCRACGTTNPWYWRECSNCYLRHPHLFLPSLKGERK